MLWIELSVVFIGVLPGEDDSKIMRRIKVAYMAAGISRLKRWVGHVVFWGLESYEFSKVTLFHFVTF